MPVLRNIGSLACCPDNGLQNEVGAIAGASLAWQGDTISWAGPEAELPDQYSAGRQFDAAGRLVIPGLIDCHTHLAFGGWRAHEFRQRLEGRTYLEIARAGGGILSTVGKTRAASRQDLVEFGTTVLSAMSELGVTCAECKSGYGLEMETEVRQLKVYRDLSRRQPVRVVATFLGAHTFPAEFKEHRETYLTELMDRMIPRVAEEGLARFCDVFVEEGAFSVEEGRTLLRRAQEFGLESKIHADQLTNCGGARLAGELKAVSADHLEYIDEQGIEALATGKVVAVALPLASFYLRSRTLDARRLIEQGVRVAVATDFNPGSAPSFHLPLAMLFGCLALGMTPGEVLKAATINAAHALHMEDRIGSLEKGKKADFAIIDSPGVDHWMYHFRANACRTTVIGGEPVWGELEPWPKE